MLVISSSNCKDEVYTNHFTSVTQFQVGLIMEMISIYSWFLHPSNSHWFVLMLFPNTTLNRCRFNFDVERFIIQIPDAAFHYLVNSKLSPKVKCLAHYVLFVDVITLIHHAELYYCIFAPYLHAVLCWSIITSLFKENTMNICIKYQYIKLTQYYYIRISKWSSLLRLYGIF